MASLQAASVQMASTRGARSKRSGKLAAHIDGFSLTSQESPDSDDSALVDAVAEQWKTSLEKKEKEKERKFIQGAKKRLLQDVSALSDDVKSTSQHIDTIYMNFISAYAGSEDDIRKQWFNIRKEQQRLLVLAEKRLTLNLEASKAAEAGQIHGMARAKEACEDLNRLIISVMPRQHQ